jgi:hypothetical protein
MERIEHDLDRVVVEDVLAPGKPGANFLGLAVEAYEDSVKILVVISQVDFSPLRNRSAVAWNPLRETRHLGQFALPCGGRLHAEEIFEPGRTGDARDTNAAKFGSVGEQARDGAKQQE